MNYALSNVIVFTTGAAIGALVSWKLLEAKYKKIADEEIKSVRDAYARKYAERDEHDEEPEVQPEVQAVEDETFGSKYTDLVTTLYKQPDNKKGEDMPKKDAKIKIITPEEFDELDEYEAVSLTYYADGVLTDVHDEPIEDVEDVVGSDFESHFGEYEDDSVFVRNDRLKKDYEILADMRNYSDVVNKSKHPAED